MEVGNEVYVKGANNKWIPARVREVENRKTIDPTKLGSPQRYQLYAINSYEDFSIRSKDFKSQLRLGPLHEDETEEAQGEHNPVVAEKVPDANANAETFVPDHGSADAEAESFAHGTFFFLDSAYSFILFR